MKKISSTIIFCFCIFYSFSQDQFLSWSLNAKGIATGKQFTLTGGSKELDCCWKLLAQQVELACPDDKVAIELTFTGTTVSLKDTLEASKIKKFPKKHFELLSNCEVFTFDIPEWTSPFYNSAVISAEIDQKKSAPEGKGCLKLQGKDENEDGYICSLTKHFKNEYTSNSSIITQVKSEASETWIFFYAYGSGNSEDVIQLLVNEAPPIGLMENESINGFYFYEITLDYVGWRQFAVNYSDLRPTVPFFVNDKRQQFGQSGDDILNPKELMGIQFTLSTKAKGGSATVWLDRLMVVFNNP